MWSWQDYISGVSGYTKVKIYLNDGNGKVNDFKIYNLYERYQSKVSIILYNKFTWVILYNK